MTKKSETIIFFGSGPVAGESLEFIAQYFNIEAVITKPRSVNHRGDVPVLRIAKKLSIPTFTASNKQDLDTLIQSKHFNSRLGILIDFGIIVSQLVIDSFSLGIINSHFSLLPRWRGADPITFAILNGDTKTGVTLIIIDSGMDTGKILTQKTIHIPQDMTTPELTHHLIKLSNNLLINAVPLYINGKTKPRRQSHPDRATYSRKLTKNDSIIDWNKSAKSLSLEVRAFYGWPSSKTVLLNRDVIITKSSVINKKSKYPGFIEVDKTRGELVVHTKSNLLKIERLKPIGKRDMSTKEFIAGYYKNI